MPTAVGEKVIASVHDEPAAPLTASGVAVEQVVDGSTANWESPLMANDANDTVCVVWLFVTVTVCRALV